MDYSLIVAVGKNGEIGKDNDLLWHLPDDMKFFKETTQNQVVIMGRKNWESIPAKFRPLPNRLNIVITRDVKYEAQGADLFTNILEMDDALNRSNEKRKCFIIGGAQIYNLAIQKLSVTEFFITHVDAQFDADTYFPSIDLAQWNAKEIHRKEANERNPYSFIIKRYSKSNT